MQRIRPAVLWLQEHIGLRQALASERLQTDGAEVRRDFGIDVVVDPWLNGGQPTVSRRGVRVADVVSRLSAHEPAEDVAADYGLTVTEVETIRRAA